MKITLSGNMMDIPMNDDSNNTVKTYQEALDIVKTFEHDEWMNVQRFKDAAIHSESATKRNKAWKDAAQCEIVHNAINRILWALIDNEKK